MINGLIQQPSSNVSASGGVSVPTFLDNLTRLEGDPSAIQAMEQRLAESAPRGFDVARKNTPGLLNKELPIQMGGLDKGIRSLENTNALDSFILRTQGLPFINRIIDPITNLALSQSATDVKDYVRGASGFIASQSGRDDTKEGREAVQKEFLPSYSSPPSVVEGKLKDVRRGARDRISNEGKVLKDFARRGSVTPSVVREILNSFDKQYQGGRQGIPEVKTTGEKALDVRDQLASIVGTGVAVAGGVGAGKAIISKILRGAGGSVVAPILKLRAARSAATGGVSSGARGVSRVNSRLSESQAQSLEDPILQPANQRKFQAREESMNNLGIQYGDPVVSHADTSGILGSASTVLKGELLNNLSANPDLFQLSDDILPTTERVNDFLRFTGSSSDLKVPLTAHFKDVLPQELLTRTSLQEETRRTREGINSLSVQVGDVLRDKGLQKHMLSRVNELYRGITGTEEGVDTPLEVIESYARNKLYPSVRIGPRGRKKIERVIDDVSKTRDQLHDFGDTGGSNTLTKFIDALKWAIRKKGGNVGDVNEILRNMERGLTAETGIFASKPTIASKKGQLRDAISTALMESDPYAHKLFESTKAIRNREITLDKFDKLVHSPKSLSKLVNTRSFPALVDSIMDYHMYKSGEGLDLTSQEVATALSSVLGTLARNLQNLKGQRITPSLSESIGGAIKPISKILQGRTLGYNRLLDDFLQNQGDREDFINELFERSGQEREEVPIPDENPWDLEDIKDSLQPDPQDQSEQPNARGN